VAVVRVEVVLGGCGPRTALGTTTMKQLLLSIHLSNLHR